MNDAESTTGFLSQETYIAACHFFVDTPISQCSALCYVRSTKNVMSLLHPSDLCPYFFVFFSSELPSALRLGQ